LETTPRLIYLRTTIEKQKSFNKMVATQQKHRVSKNNCFGN